MAGELEFQAAHELGDLDATPMSLHHTLGPNATQAAAGNHKHDDYSHVDHTHDMAPSSHAHQFSNLLDTEIVSPVTGQIPVFDGVAAKWKNAKQADSAHSQIAATPPTPRGVGDLWVDTSADLLSWDDTWTAPTLKGVWSQYAGWNIRFRKTAGGLVVGKGLATPSTNIGYSVIYTLPPGYRPLEKIHLSTVSGGVHAAMGIEESGNVVSDSNLSASVWYSVCFTFYAEQ